MARIGIFGGSFNPPHCGHVLALEEFYHKLRLDCILVIPAAIPPHKQLSMNSPDPQTRLELTRAATAHLPYVEVSDLELRREGNSYTADTVMLLRERFPSDELFLLMGTDMLLSFHTWHQPERITKEVTLAVAHRNTDNATQLAQSAEELRASLGAAVAFVDNRYLPYSSTAVRAMLAFRCGAPYLVPPVYQMIVERGLYLTKTNLTDLPFAQLKMYSLCLHNAKRVPHVIGCSQTARDMAVHYGADPVAAERAGILHDVTKALGAEEQLKLCEKYDILLDNFERKNSKLLHAKTGAEIAFRIFGESSAVRDAILWHTTGRANMTLLEKIIYLADYMEPNRVFEGVEELRRLAWKDLDAAVLMGLEMSVSQLKSRGSAIDANSLSALRFLKERML